MNFDMEAVYRKWMDDFEDAQRPDGQLSSIVPTPANFGWNGGPAWDCAFILIPYYLYRYTGKKDLIEKHYPAFEKYMDFLHTMAEEDCLPYVALGDWAPPEVTRRIDHGITANCYYHTLAVVMAECAEILGKDPTGYRELAQRIRQSYYRNYILPKAPDMDSQSAIACGIYHGMYEQKDIPAAMNRLVQLIEVDQEHFHTGILGTKAMFTVLTENGQAELLYRMITNPTMPSYAYWIRQGMTTLCEHWDMTASRNHHMYSEVDFWFYKYLAGIQIQGDEIRIKPCFLKEIKWVKCYHKEIHVSWDESRITVTVPREATLILDEKEIRLKPGTTVTERKAV